MPKAAQEVFPHQIDMSWAAENPGAGSDVGGHLEAYTRARTDWAEAMHEAWTVQHRAAGLRDKATALLGGKGHAVSDMSRERDGTELVTKGTVDEWTVGRASLFLGRTSLALAYSASEENRSPKAVTRRNGLRYTYGMGEQAERARGLETALIASAEAAAASVLQDPLVDPEVAAVRHSVLTAKETHAQLDPAHFAESALELVARAKRTLAETEWLALIGRYDLQVEASSPSAPLGIVAVGGSLQLVSAQAAGRKFAHAQGNDHDDSSYAVPNWPVIAETKTHETITLLDAQSVGDTPESSFGSLRDIIERQRDPKVRRLFLPHEVAGLKKSHQRSTRLAAVLALRTVGFEAPFAIDDEKAGIVGELAEALHHQVNPPKQPPVRRRWSGWVSARAAPALFADASLTYLQELTQALHISRGDVETAIQERYGNRQEPGSLEAITEQERSAEILRAMTASLDAIFAASEKVSEK